MKIKDLFTDTVRSIIEEELDEIQHEQFLIEGEETINSLFSTDVLPQYGSEEDLLPDVGISPEGLSLDAIGVTFLQVILGCYTLLKHMRATADTGPGWNVALERQGTNPALIGLLSTRYAAAIQKIALLS